MGLGPSWLLSRLPTSFCSSKRINTGKSSTFARQPSMKKSRPWGKWLKEANDQHLSMFKAIMYIQIVHQIKYHLHRCPTTPKALCLSPSISPTSRYRPRWPTFRDLPSSYLLIWPPQSLWSQDFIEPTDVPFDCNSELTFWARISLGLLICCSSEPLPRYYLMKRVLNSSFSRLLSMVFIVLHGGTLHLHGHRLDRRCWTFNQSWSF